MKPILRKIFLQFVAITCVAITGGIAMGHDDGTSDQDLLLSDDSQKEKSTDVEAASTFKDSLKFFDAALPRDVPLLGGLFNFHLIAAETCWIKKTINRTIQYRLYVQNTCQGKFVNFLTHKLVTVMLKNVKGSSHLKIMVTGNQSEFSVKQPCLLHKWCKFAHTSTLDTVTSVIKSVLKIELFILICIKNYQQNRPLACDNEFDCKNRMFEMRQRTLRISPAFVLLKCGHCFHVGCIESLLSLCDKSGICPLCKTPFFVSEELTACMPVPKKIVFAMQGTRDDFIDEQF
jgi:hypothetical protein